MGLALVVVAVGWASVEHRSTTDVAVTPASESASASASATPSAPFQIINTPLRQAGLPAGWVRIESSDGRFSMVGPGDATLQPATPGFWKLLIPGNYPTFYIYIYDRGLPDPADPQAYTRARLRSWAAEFGELDELHSVQLGQAVGWRARMANERGSRGAAQVVVHDGLEISMTYYRIGNPLGKRGRRLGLAVFNSLRMPAGDVVTPA